MDLPDDRALMKEEIKNRLKFEEPIEGTVPGSNPPATFHRLGWTWLNPDGSTGDLVISLDRSFSFGVGENRAPSADASVPMSDRKLNGYSVAISMHNIEGATPKQLKSVQFIECLVEVIKAYICDPATKEATGLDISEGELKKFNPLYYKKEKVGKISKIIEGASPSFYPKLIWLAAGKDKKTEKERPERMLTHFYSEDEVDEEGNPAEVNPLQFLNVKHYITAAIKFEGAFLGALIKNMQVKVYEAEVKEAETGPKRLLKSSPRTPATITVAGGGGLLKRTVDPEPPVASAGPAISAPVQAPAVKPAPVKAEPKLEVSDDEGEGEESKAEIVKPPSPKVEKVRTVKVKAAHREK